MLASSEIMQLLMFCVLVCSGGVGFDINCGVRLIRTNLTEKDVAPIKEQLAQVQYTSAMQGIMWCNMQQDLCCIFHAYKHKCIPTYAPPHSQCPIGSLH